MSAPGSLALDRLIDQVGGTALDADMRRYYRADLTHLWREPGGLSPRRVLWWVEHLPEDSATVAALRGGHEHRAWTSAAHLLASVVDAVQVNTWTTVAAHAKRRPKPPTPLPRPTSPSRRAARVVTVAEIAAQQEQAGTRG